MSELAIICPRCKMVSTQGTEYCRQCGEVIGQKTRAELQRLAIILRDLDKRIVAKKGNQTVADLQSEYYIQYQDLRRPPWQRLTTGVNRPQPAPVPFATLQQEMAAPRAATPAARSSEFIAPPVAEPPRPAASLAQKLTMPPTPDPDAQVAAAAAPRAAAASA